MSLHTVDRRPERRGLRIFAYDAMRARGGDHRITIEVPYREITLLPEPAAGTVTAAKGFQDDRLIVVDFDASINRYYSAVNLDDPRIAMQQGLEPSEADPQFHQQMVYAVASRVLENFDRALGRRLRFRGGQRLRLLPHAFRGRNAYYDPELVAVVFGYFNADEDNPGENLPSQFIFTCLSHDVIAHEVTHAAFDRIHVNYREPTNPHVPALHEGFADIVAVLQKLTLPDLVRAVLREARGDLAGQDNPLAEVGSQFGAAVGLGRALRSALTPELKVQETDDPHELGNLLLAAVFDGFLRTYQRRTADLVRIATGGLARLPDADMHPDLLQRLVNECTRTAQSVLLMCIRATDYLPPVDPTFSDFLRGMITADYEVNRADEYGLRASMIEAFRLRGIQPQARSLAVESVLLQPCDPASSPDEQLGAIVRDLTDRGAREMSRNARLTAPAISTRRAPVPSVSSPADWAQQNMAPLNPPAELIESELSEDDEPDPQWRSIGSRLGQWVRANKLQLGLSEDLKAQVQGYHPVHRIAPSGELLVEMVAKIVQTKEATGEDLGGLRDRAGVTLIAGIDGRIRYLIAKPFTQTRMASMRKWVADYDAGMLPAWRKDAAPSDRMLTAFSMRAMDRKKWR